MTLKVDIIILDMVNFDGILAMDWLVFYHAMLDCYAKIVTLARSDIPRLDWNGTLNLSLEGVYLLYVLIA